MTNQTPRALPTPQDIVQHLDQFVYGQYLAKRDLAVAVYNHYLGLGFSDQRADAPDDDAPARPGAAFGKQHALLMGPTGSGKTYLIRLIAELLGVPYIFVAATSLVQTGYVGQRIENVIGQLYLATDRDRDRAERGIVLIDEIDKIAAHRGGSGPDIGGEGVQQALLSVLDGRTVMASTGGAADSPLGELDTSRMLFIGAGAFVGLAEQARRRRRRGATGIGFAPVAGRAADGDDDLPGTEDLIDFGLIPEFVGRFATLTATRALTATDLVGVLENSADSVLPRQRRLFAVHGIDLEFTPCALRAVAEEADALGTGARGLARVVLRSLAEVDFRLPELAAAGVTGVTVTADVVHGRAAAGLRRSHRRRAAPGAARRRRAATSPRVTADDLRARALQPRGETSLAGVGASDAGFTDARGLSKSRIRERLERVKAEIAWDETTGSARKWWEAFEKENEDRLHTVLRCAEELRARRATVTEFFLACVYGNSDDLRASLHYLDYTRARKASENRKQLDKVTDTGPGPE